MILKEAGIFVPTCNICGTTLSMQSNYADAATSMKQEGWQWKKVDGYWEHYCPDCQG